MEKLQSTVNNFLATRGAQVELWGFVLNLALAALLSYLLGRVYIRYGMALSNRRVLARTFVLTTMATMLVITIVKSSLALSLGLVGALSIVRFRAAIKEPEELAYLFLAVAIGLGFGADQRVVTATAFAVIVGIVWLKNRSVAGEPNHNLHLTVSSHNPRKVTLKEVVGVLDRHCSAVNLRRFDETKEVLEASFVVNFEGYAGLEATAQDLQKLGDAVSVSFLDSSRVGATA